MTTRMWPLIVLGTALSVPVLPAADQPASADDALEVVASARRAVAALPVLTGTEGFSVEALRQSLSDARGAAPYEDFLTAEAVAEFAKRASTTVEQLMLFNSGWTALEVNWLYATLLGDSESASRLLVESNRLVNLQSAYMGNVEQGTASFASFYTTIEGNSYALRLHRMASEMNLISLIPNEMDPEGYLRQRMQTAYNRLTNTAAFIHTASEAFSSPYL